jgi:ribulose-phosphate 3-epimerase
VAAVRQATTKIIDVHLMVDDADTWIGPFVEAGADMITIHGRSTPNLAASLHSIRNMGKAPSLALETHESVENVFDTTLDHDRVLLMGTKIGIKGVDIDAEIYGRTERAVALRDAKRPTAEVFVDGGIRSHTVGDLAHSGADGVIPGSLVYAVDDACGAIHHLHSLHR